MGDNPIVRFARAAWNSRIFTAAAAVVIAMVMQYAEWIGLPRFVPSDWRTLCLTALALGCIVRCSVLLRRDPVDNAFSVLVLRLDGDDADAQRDLISAEIRVQLGKAARIVTENACIPLPSRADATQEVAATRLAQAQYNETGCAVILWGAVVGGRLRLRTTLPDRNEADPDSQLTAGAELDLPLNDAERAAPVIAARLSFLGAPVAHDVRKLVAPAMRRLMARLDALAGSDKTGLRVAAMREAAALQLSLAMQTDGAPALHAAIARFDAALAAGPRTDDPPRWAEIQIIRASALRMAGMVEGGLGSLRDAVAACDAALAVLTPDVAPFRHGAAQFERASALTLIGMIEGGTDTLRQATQAYRAALAQFTADRLPLQRTMIQNEFGGALRQLGQREPGTAALDEAVHVFEEAIRIFERLDPAAVSTALIGNQARAMIQIAERRGDAAMARTAADKLIHARDMTLAYGGDREMAAEYEAEAADAIHLAERLAKR